MTRFTPWRSRTAMFLAASLTAAATLPLLSGAESLAQAPPQRMAQLLEQRLNYRLPSGTLIPTAYTEAERIILKPDETVPVDLVVSADVRSPRNNRVVIPTGSVITGELRPDGDGVRFVATTVTLATSTETTQAISATSDRLTDREVISEDSDPDILRGAAIGAAAAAILAEVLGDIDILEVLGGAGVGVLAEILIDNGRNQEVEVIVIEPDADLDLTLQSEFVRS